MKKLLKFKQHNPTDTPVVLSNVEHTATVPDFHQTQQRTFYLSLAALLFSCGAFALNGLKPIDSFQNNIVIVDLNQLLRQKASALIQSKSMEESDVKRDLQLAEQARQIRAQIENYAKSNNVTVLSKGAVFGSNIRDVTDELAAIV
jgi:hypothetical protein